MSDNTIHQGDKQLYLSDDRKTAILLCCCGDLDHGQIRIDTAATPIYEDFYDDELFSFGANFGPLYWEKKVLWSERLGTVARRLKACWSILRGGWTDICFNMNGATARQVGEWLIERSDTEKAILEASKKEREAGMAPRKLTLSDIRREANEQPPAE